MLDKLKEIQDKFTENIQHIQDLKALEELRVSFFGKKGELTQILRSMGSLTPEERPLAGQKVNEVRAQLEELLGSAKKKLISSAQAVSLQLESLDVTMPGKIPPIGRKHPMTSVIDEIKTTFIGMGYEIAEGPDIETNYYNFEALNIPEDHPARDAQDTFYTEGGFVLRTATSPVQVHVMERGVLPIRVIAPGRVYRADEVDATHSPMFTQLEGLVVDKGITFRDLKGSLAVFAKELFGAKTTVRFRPHYFPFTEPSAEMDASCFFCDGVGCRICKDSGFIEILGCGMVHPKVLKMSGIDPDVYSGFAFGMGLERVAMMRYSIADMRLLYENDMKFLAQF